MGGRGSFAKGINMPYGKYEEIGKIDGIKILKGTQGNHKLPEESASSKGYIRQDHNGNFKEMRLYDENHHIKLEIAYHREPNLTKNLNDKVLHVHEYKNGDFDSRTIRLITPEEYNKYKKFFGGIK